MLRTGIWVIALIAVVIGFIPVVSTTAAPITIRENHQTAAGSTPLKAGQNVKIPAKDFTVNDMNSGGNARMLIWNLKNETGDEIQVLVDGKPIHDAVELTDSVIAFSVPVPSVVTVKGLNSPHGDILYGVKFPNKNLTIYNAVTQKTGNQYTLTPKP